MARGMVGPALVAAAWLATTGGCVESMLATGATSVAASAPVFYEAATCRDPCGDKRDIEHAFEAVAVTAAIATVAQLLGAYVLAQSAFTM